MYIDVLHRSGWRVEIEGDAILGKQEEIESVSLPVTCQSLFFHFRTPIGAASGLAQCQIGWWFEYDPL